MGTGVEVGMGVSGVADAVGVKVIVEVGEGVGDTTGSGLLRKAKNTSTAPSPRNRASKPRAAGRLTVIVGIRLPWTALEDVASAPPLTSVPQTRQRVASSGSFVPQVGHSSIDFAPDSSIILARLASGRGGLYQS